MAGCDGWITIKVVELILSIVCIIYKRVTDDEANKLFYFLQKYSREWPLLNNITWEENGAIFTDVTYGGFIVIVLGLIIGQSTGELDRHGKMENFFLIAGALMFISAGSLELAALDSVEERLVDNAAILGVMSLVTGFVFILDLLVAGKRRKRSRARAALGKKTAPKGTQTEERSDANGNPDGGWRKIPRNGVKILPEMASAPPPPPLYTANDLKTPDARIRSTESFLRSEKGEYREGEWRRRRNAPREVYVPPGFVLVATEDKPESAIKAPGYVMIPVDGYGRNGFCGSASDVSDADDKRGEWMTGRTNEGFDGDGGLRRSRRASKPKSILRFDRIRTKDEDRYDSLDSRKIAEDLRHLKEITNPARETNAERKKSEERIGEAEDAERLLKLEKRMREREEKDRRVSEREEQYFGVLDLEKSRRGGGGAAPRADKLEDKIVDEGFYFLDDERKETPTDEERRATPAGSSYKSEAQVWLGSDGEVKDGGGTPTSPGDPGFVLHTVQNWPETPSPSPHDRFLFSAKKAQRLKISKTPSPDTEEEYSPPRIGQRSLPSRRVDFSNVPRPATAIGGTTAWRKWLHPKERPGNHAAFA